MKNNYKNNQNGINTAAIGNKLQQHLAERAKLQRQHDDLWSLIKRGYNRHGELKKVDSEIGKNTYAIDGLIGQLIKFRCRSCKAYSMAINYLKSEIARNQRIISKWLSDIDDVQRGRAHWINSRGAIHYDCTFAFEYVAKKKQKTADVQRLLSKLL